MDMVPVADDLVIRVAVLQEKDKHLLAKLDGLIGHCRICRSKVMIDPHWREMPGAEFVCTRCETMDETIRATMKVCAQTADNMADTLERLRKKSNTRTALRALAEAFRASGARGLEAELPATADLIPPATPPKRLAPKLPPEWSRIRRCPMARACAPDGV